MWTPSSGLTNSGSMKTIKHCSLIWHDHNCLLQFYIWIWLEGACDTTTLVLSIWQCAAEVWSQQWFPMKPAQLSRVRIKLRECGRASMAWWGKFTYTLQWEWKDQVRIKILSDFLLLILNHLLDPIHPRERLRCLGTWSTNVSIHHRKLLILRGKMQKEPQDRAKRKAMMQKSLFILQIFIAWS